MKHTKVTVRTYREDGDGNETVIEARCEVSRGRTATYYDPAEPGCIEIVELTIDGFDAPLSALTDKEHASLIEKAGLEATL